MRIIAILLTLMLAGVYHLRAGAADALRFRTFSPKGGFYYDGVVDISQDTDGFIRVMLDRIFCGLTDMSIGNTPLSLRAPTMVRMIHS